MEKNFGTMKDGEVTDFVHTFRVLYISSNIDLVKSTNLSFLNLS